MWSGRVLARCCACANELTETLQTHTRLRYIARLEDMLHAVIDLHAHRNGGVRGAIAELGRVVAQDLGAAGMNHDRRIAPEIGESRRSIGIARIGLLEIVARADEEQFPA